MPLPWVYHLQDGYDLGDLTDDLQGAGEAIVAALTLQDDQRAIAGAPWHLCAGREQAPGQPLPTLLCAWSGLQSVLTRVPLLAIQLLQRARWA